MAEIHDPFHNPVDAILREHLPVLLEQVLGPMDEAIVWRALDPVARLRAVQVSTSAEAVDVLASVECAARERAAAGDAALVRSRLATMRDVAERLFEAHRDRIRAIREHEASRRTYVARRLMERLVK
jgi:hypothetical protein